MMRQILMTGTALAACLTAAIPADALDRTQPSPRDQNVRYVSYDPDNVVPLRGGMGTALMVVFSSEEAIIKVPVSDSERLMTDAVKNGERLGNYLFLKPIVLEGDPPGYVLPPQPFMVVTERKGVLRHYQFIMQAQPAGQALDYAVFFRYPGDAGDRRQVDTRERDRRAEELETRRYLRSETNLVSPVPNTFEGARNYQYTAQGDATLAPAWVWDTGYVTYFNWPNMQRLPSVFRGRCGQDEATADTSTHGDIVIAPGTSRFWCLRDERSAIEVTNLGWSQYGATPNTGSISPYVARTLIDAR
jgi:type IV secretion system protein VirB9